MHTRRLVSLLSVVPLLLWGAAAGGAQPAPSTLPQAYEHKETRQLVALVNDASKLVSTNGEAAFADFAVSGSRWRSGETYVFVLDPEGNMLVHPDPALAGTNTWDQKDINGKLITRGIIASATALSGKPEGWYHYEWTVSGELLPRWKSTYARLVTAPSGKRYIVAAGMYNDRMERAFVVDEVTNAVAEIEKDGPTAFSLFRDPAGPYLSKDTYLFVVDPNGVQLVNPPFPNLDGRNLLQMKDTQGKPFLQEMLAVVRTRGSGWVDYMWPKPGENISTRKSAYVSQARLGNSWVLVGCGVYLADAPKAAHAVTKMTAPELMALVREGAAVFERDGEKAFPAFRAKGSKWFNDDTYFFVATLDGTRVFHAADPSLEGRNVKDTKDALGRPYGRMMLDAIASPSGEGWVHYMYPEPGGVFPTWKSVFVKRVTSPSGKDYFIGSGIYNMKMDRAFVEDEVNRAAALVAQLGPAAFPQLRDKKGPFVFMDTYVFVESPIGTELVNPAQPSLEGKSVISLKDLNGNEVIRQQIAEVMKQGSAWVNLSWYKPGTNEPARKLTYLRKVQYGQETYIVGSGVYLE